MITAKKGDKVIVKGFTGMKLGVFEVASANKATITIMKNNGDELIFDRKTGKQTNVEEGKEKYANVVIDDDGSFVPPNRAKKTAPAKAKSNKVEEPEDEDEEDEEDEDEEPVKPKKAAKKPAKKPVKKAKVVEDDDDDDDFEEIDD